MNYKHHLVQIAGLILLVTGYRALAHYAGWPGPSGILLALQLQWQEGLLAHDLEVSIARWMLGWLPGAITGVGLGLLGGSFSPVRNFLKPYRLMLRALPFIGLVPIATRLYGTSETGKRLLIAWITCSVCWPIVENAATAIPIHVLWKAKTLEAGWLDRIRLILAYSAPAIFSALRTSLSLGWILVALVEMSGVYQQSAGNFWSEGLGYRLFRAQEDGQDGLMIASLLTFAVVGGVGEILFARLWKAVHQLDLYWRKMRILRSTSALKQSLPAAKAKQSNDVGSLKVEHLWASYKDAFTLADCNFAVNAGETLPILGESGSGKTTLLRALANLTGEDLHVGGRVLIDGEPAGGDQRIGVVFQDALVFPMLTVWENAIYGKHARTDLAYAYTLLADFGIVDLIAQTAGTLSGGQRQRLALVSALANQPKILLLDEPFGALDAITRSRLQVLFVAQVRGKITCLFVTHDINEAMKVASEKIMIGLGRKAHLFTLQKPCKASSSREDDGVRGSLEHTLRNVSTRSALD